MTQITAKEKIQTDSRLRGLHRFWRSALAAYVLFLPILSLSLYLTRRIASDDAGTLASTYTHVLLFAGVPGILSTSMVALHLDKPLIFKSVRHATITGPIAMATVAIALTGIVCVALGWFSAERTQWISLLLSGAAVGAAFGWLLVRFARYERLT